jgi:predicted DNA-binding transcriptional regulator AlpA
MEQAATQPDTAAKRAFSITEAAQMVGLSRAALYLEMRDGALKARKLRGRTVVLAADIDTYLRNAPAYSPESA